MQQRRLRLGDILDDYCPRERRITNHAVVAMIEDAVKQTRCTTCDADHEYKQARVPARRKKDGGALVGELAAGSRPRAAAATVDEAPLDLEADDTLIDDDVSEAAPAASSVPAPAVHAAAPADDERVVEEPELEPEPEIDEPRIEEDGPVHRRLIRATLPRPEGQAPEWKDPEFTVRQPGGRGGFDANRNGHRNGGRPGGAGPGGGRPRAARGQSGPAHGNQTRFGGPRQGNNTRHGSGPQHPPGQGSNRGGRPGQGPGQGAGQGQSRGQRPGGGQGRKRGR